MTKRTGLALSVLLFASAMASAAAAGPPLPNLVNLNFSQYSGSNPKDYFTNVNPLGWTGGGGLIFIASTAAGHGAGDPGYLQTYGNPTGSVTGNYVEADGNPDFEGSFNYSVTGLTAGTTYTLSFYQGASQQLGFANGLPTTSQWIVSLAQSGMSILNGGGPIDPIYGQTSSYYNTDPNASIATSQLMVVPSGGTVGWDYVSVNLTAHHETELLSFLAWGDNGSRINLPPIAFLAGINSPPGLGSNTPEPEEWALLLMGFAGLGSMLRRHRSKVLATQA